MRHRYPSGVRFAQVPPPTVAHARFGPPLKFWRLVPTALKNVLARVPAPTDGALADCALQCRAHARGLHRDRIGARSARLYFEEVQPEAFTSLRLTLTAPLSATKKNVETA